MEPPSDAKSDSKRPESSLFSDKNFFNFFDDLPDIDKDKLGPGLPSPPLEDLESITSTYVVPPNVDPNTGMDNVFSRNPIKVKNDGNQEMLSGSLKDQETKNSGSVVDQGNVDDEDIELLQGFTQYLAATITKPRKDDIVKEFVKSFLRSDADPEEVTKRIRALMKRYLDSLKNDSEKGKTGGPSSRSPQDKKVFVFCRMIHHLIIFASVFSMEGMENFDGGSSIDEEIPGDIEILPGFLEYSVAKNMKPYPYSFSYDELNDFVKNWLHSDAHPKEVDKRIRESMEKHEDYLKNQENRKPGGPSSSDHDRKASRLCQKIIGSVPDGVSGSSNSDEETRSSGSVDDAGTADKNPRDDEFPESEKFKKLELL